MSPFPCSAPPRPGPRGGFRRALCLVGLPAALLCLFSSTMFAAPYAPEAPYGEAYLAGRYAEAVAIAEGAFSEKLGVVPPEWIADHAELLFVVGRYDEAIAEMGDAVRRVYEPVYTVRLAEMYRAVGKLDDANQAIDLAIQQSQRGYRQENSRENLLAMGRVARLQGENPRRILQIYQERLLGRFPDFAPGFEAAGEIALEGYGYDLAEKYFLEALKLDGTRQDALAGLAATYHRSGDPRFDEVRAKLEALNPNHPRLLCLVIERLLTAGESDAATAQLDKLLAVNPLHFEGLAWLAAAAFLDGDTAQQEATLAKLAELRPGSAEGHRVVAELAARRYRFDEAIALLRAGLQLEPENRQAKASLGLNLLRTGADATGRVLLEEVFAEDAFNLQVYNMLEVMDSLDGFATLTTPDFEVRLPPLEAAVMGDALKELLGEALQRYGAEYATEMKRPVAVQLFDDHDEFMVRSVGLPGNPGHLGICFGNLVTLDSPRARPPRTMNWRSVLWHEFVHVITLQKTKNRIPRWLSEGISVYEEGQRDPAWGQPLDPEFAPLLKEGAWPGVESLEALFVSPETPLHLMLGYYLAGEFVETYVAAYGKPALVSALDAIGAGTPAEEALLVAAGTDRAGLNTRFAEHLTIACAPLKHLAVTPAPEAAAALLDLSDGAFTKAMDAGFAAQAAGDVDTAIAQFEAAAALYPAFPGEANPLRQLALIQATRGDPAAWTAAVKRLQQVDPTAYDETRPLLLALAKQADWPAVIELGQWCFGIDPFDLEVHEARRSAQAALGDHEGLLKTLDILMAIDPTKGDDFRLAKAALLLDLSRNDEARTVLLALLEAYPEFREAQELLLRLHSEVEVASDEAS